MKVPENTLKLIIAFTFWSINFIIQHFLGIEFQNQLFPVKLGVAFKAQTDIKFWLYTRNNFDSPDYITMNERSLHSSNFNKTCNTRFLIHGLSNDLTSPFNVVSRKALLKSSNQNVIVVDWGPGANLLYPFAR